MAATGEKPMAVDTVRAGPMYRLDALVLVAVRSLSQCADE